MKDSYFKAQDSFKLKDTKFEFDFISDNKIYTYGFSVNLFNLSLKEEWLYRNEGGDDLALFNIDYSKPFDKNHFSIENWGLLEKDIPRFDIYVSDAQKSNSLFLKYINTPERKIDYSIDVYKAYEWFLQTLEIIEPEGEVSRSAEVFLKQEDTDKLARFLHSFSTGINAIEREEITKADIDESQMTGY